MSESKPVVVRSTSNSKIRHLIRMRNNRARRKAERVIVDGWRETGRAIDAGLTLIQIYLPESSSERHIAHVAPHGDKTVLVSDSLMEKICFGDSPRSVVAEFERPVRPLDRLQLSDQPLILVLDRLEKPGNVGAIFRCADAVGVDAVLLCESADPFNPNAIRNSAGSVFHVPSASGTAVELADFLLGNEIAAIAARVESSKPLWDVDFRGPRAIIVGSEAEGLGDRWQSLRGSGSAATKIDGVRIPMHGIGDSLNVSVSAALICYEACRQRGS